MLHDKVRFPKSSGIGIKPVSNEGTTRIVKAAIQYAIDNDKSSVTLVHKGNIMKFTEGAFRDWGYECSKNEFGACEIDGGPWCTLKNPKTGSHDHDQGRHRGCLPAADSHASTGVFRYRDDEPQRRLHLRRARCVCRRIGIAPGANINYDTGHAIFEATHGTAPKYAGQDKVNPGSLILSGEMMLRFLGWTEAADLVIQGISGAIEARTVTYDFERLMEGATLLKCSEFGDAIIKHMGAGVPASA